jgi:hypothetical protein
MIEIETPKDNFSVRFILRFDIPAQVGYVFALAVAISFIHLVCVSLEFQRESEVGCQQVPQTKSILEKET